MEATWPWGDRRCFALHTSPRDGAAELEEEDRRHLVRVLRARVGDRVLGLDGKGSAWPLKVAAISGGELELAADGDPYSEPPPGEPDARVRRIEVAVAWPRPQVGEELLDGLTQLGCARVTALVGARSQEWAREWSPARHARLERVGREACKQSRRLWAIEFDGPIEFEAWLADPRALAVPTLLLDPRAVTSLSAAVAAALSRAPQAVLRLAIGPEGGWSEDERASAARCGAQAVRIESFVLRTELAAQAAAAIALQ